MLNLMSQNRLFLRKKINRKIFNLRKTFKRNRNSFKNAKHKKRRYRRFWKIRKGLKFRKKKSRIKLVKNNVRKWKRKTFINKLIYKKRTMLKTRRMMKLKLRKYYKSKLYNKNKKRKIFRKKKRPYDRKFKLRAKRLPNFKKKFIGICKWYRITKYGLREQHKKRAIKLFAKYLTAL